MQDDIDNPTGGSAEGWYAAMVDHAMTDLATWEARYANWPEFSRIGPQVSAFLELGDREAQARIAQEELPPPAPEPQP